MRKLLLTFIALLILSFRVFSQPANKSYDDVSLDKKIGQLLTIGFRGMAIADTNHIVRDIQKYHLGGVVLFDYDVPRGEAVRNIRSPKQLKSLVKELKSLSNEPLIVSIDQEGGRVNRLKPKYGFPPSVSAQYLGEINDKDSTQKYAHRTATTLSNLGINVNFAPVVDLNVNPENPIIGKLERSYSANPATVVKQAGTFIDVLNDHNIQTVLKHFPGHGSSENDSHLGVVDVTETWSRKELIPYRRLIKSGQANAVMTAHIFNAQLDSTYPATLSKPTITGLLRDKLGYDGVVFSDDLMMGAIRKEYGLETAIKQAIIAGVDILTFGNNSIYDPDIVPKAHRIITELVQNGEIGEDRITQSYRRIMEFKATFK
ncbi:glycoside hydrolase family 3 protein [Fodinibius halophilus]|uniref:beta-N-acetylhexosaminidase n=1 Tax=Fodinibius halophilus TaxID=1736908 RepID=A0A6M1SYD9_9BACT|nr:glycoside hydrolase family 3 N-terminal domain-containing protein [Fodinibius halophilus]NGP88386.1 glycoside hydrolase family 3 [Fodinibius halophilus]